MNREKLEKNIASNLTIDLDVEKYIEITLLDIEKYANQRVIEELEKLGDSIPYWSSGMSSKELKNRIKEAEPTPKEIEINKYGELLKDFMEPYIEPNSKGNDTIEVANSELEDFYYSLGWRVRRWVKVAISREKEKKK